MIAWDGNGLECWDDYWYCFANEESTGYVYCEHRINEDSYFSIMTFQPDERIFEYHRGTMICVAGGDIVADKICKALGGNLSEVGLYEEAEERVYKLN